MRNGIYFDEKQFRKRRRILRMKIYGGIATFFVLLIGVGYLIIYSPLFEIKRIDAGQNQQLIDELKIFFTNQSKTASFLGPNNILIWNNKTENFLKNYPLIAEITIKKNYLDRQVQISVKERERFGIWCLLPLADNASTTEANFTSQSAKSVGCFWFDKNGVLFAEAPAMEGELIRKVNDSTNRSLKVGDRILEQNLLENLLKIFAVLEESGLNAKNLFLENLALQEIIVESPAFPKIYFSLRINPGFALPAIQSLKESGINKLDYIDFRVENRAYYKPK